MKMHETESSEDPTGGLNLDALADLDPGTLCTLAECGELKEGQFLTVLQRSRDDVVQVVFESIKDATLEGFLMRSDLFEPLLNLATAALGVNSMRSRVKTWLVNASKTQAKSDVIRCTRIIQYLTSHPSNNPTPGFVRASQPSIATAGLLGPNTQPTSPMQAPPVDLGSAQGSQLSAPQTPRPGSVSPPHAKHTASHLPRAPELFPLDIRDTSPSTPQQPTPARPKSPPRPVRRTPAAHLPAVSKSASSSLPRSPTTPISQPLRSNHTSTERHVLSPSSQPPAPANEASSQVLPSHQPVPPATAKASEIAPARNPLRSNVTQAEDGAEAVDSQNAGNQKPNPLAAAPLDELATNPGEPNDSVGPEKGPECDSNAEEPEREAPVVYPSSGNPWGEATNTARLKKWGMENAIHGNRYHTSPVRTRWMYEDRKEATGKSDAEYIALTNEEYSRFLKIPPAMRAPAGLVFHKKSKFDWEIRVVLGRIAYDYSQIDEPQNATFLREALKDIENRFPDLSPSHIFRQIEGKKAVQKWWSDVYKWVQTTAGKMIGTEDKLGQHVEMLENKQSSKKYDVHKLLGVKRATVNYVAWGQTDVAKSTCDPLIDDEMAVWKAQPENQALIEQDGKVVGQERLQVEGRIRQQEFEKLTAEEQAKYSKKDKNAINLQTEEEVQAVAECLFSHLNLVCVQAANLGGLHITLMASGPITGGRLPVVIREYGVKPDPGPFLDKQGVGGRAASEYAAYVATRFKADPSELEVFDKGIDDDFATPGAGSSKGKGKAKGKEKASTLPESSTDLQAQPSTQRVNWSFSAWAPPANANTDKKRADYLSRFLGKTFKNNFASQLSWNNISANNERFIEAQRRPRDAHDQPVILMNPAAMPVETHLNPWWDFMQRCAKGQVPEDKVFCWKPETTRLAIPTIHPPADPDVHQSGELSRTARVKKRSREPNAAARKSQKARRKARPASDEPGLDLAEDVEGLMEDAERAEQGEEEVVSTRVLRARRASNLAQVRSSTDSPDSNEEDSFESGSDGSDGQSEANGRSRKTRAIPLRSRSTRLRVLSPEPQDAADATPGDATSPHSLPLPSLDDSIPTDPKAPIINPRDQTPAEAADDSICRPEEPPSPSAKSPEVGSEQAPPGEPQAALIATWTSSNPDRTSLQPSNDVVIPNPCAVGVSGVVSGLDRSLEAAGNATLEPSPVPVAGAASTLAEPPLKPSGKTNVAARSFPGKSSTNPALSPPRLQPYTEIRLGHPQMFTGEGAASGSPGWLQVKPLLGVWASKVSFLDLSYRDIFYDPASPKQDLHLPSALTSAVSIMQIFLAMQQGDPHRPAVPLVRVSPTCGLDALHPHHHLRQVVEGILDVEAPLTTTKGFEANMLLKGDGVHAFFGVLEGGLESLIDDLTIDDRTIRYGEIEFFTALRLAIFVKQTALMHDEAAKGPAATRVTSLLDRFVSVLAAIAALRYMQEYLGDAARRWHREERQKDNAQREMWFSVGQLWNVAMAGLASALSQKRQDLFLFKGVDSLLAPPVKSVIQLLLAQPAWWSPPGNGIPVAFNVGVKQFIPSASLFDRLPGISWPRLSFIDRCSVLLTIFLCAIQLSQEPDASPNLEISPDYASDSLIELFSRRCSDLKQVIEGAAGSEMGPKLGLDQSEAAVRRRKMVQAWIAVWATEVGAQPEVASTSVSAPAHDAAITDGVLPSQSHASSIVPATPSVTEEHQGVEGSAEVDQQDARGLPPIAEEHEDEPAGAPSGDGDSDLPAAVVGVGEKKPKRRVMVGARRTAPPSVGAAENPRQRLRRAEASMQEEEQEEKPRRTAYLKNAYATKPAAARSEDQTVDSQGPSIPKASASKKPKAAVSKAKALAKSSAPSGSPRKLTKRQQAVEEAAKKGSKK